MQFHSTCALLLVLPCGLSMRSLQAQPPRGSETIFPGDLGVTVRVYGTHALGVQYVASTRASQYGKQVDQRFTEGAVTLTYSLLGGNHFSAVKW